MFHDYMMNIRKRAKRTADSYSGSYPNHPKVKSIIKEESSKDSIYDVLDLSVLNRIFNKVNALELNKRGHNGHSCSISMYMSFLIWLGKKDEPSVNGRIDVSYSKESPLDIPSIVQAIKASGLLYSDDLIARFVLSLMTKPFVILSGLAGSGKTKLAIALAKAMSERKEQMCIVPVGADWTNREPLLGYPNALVNGEYVTPESGVLQLLLNASKDKSHPYFLILDEMNLSYVERYFADFLSAMESDEVIHLWDIDHQDATNQMIQNVSNTPGSVELSHNLYIIGTINVDETTYMFSPKVLDRANVIEFKIDEKDIKTYLENVSPVNVDSILGSLSDLAVSFVELSMNPVESGFEDSKEILLSFFNQLKSVNAEFGYRTASEIGRFIALSRSLNSLPKEKAVDAAIVQKLLPKLHGSRKKLSPVLSSLWTICVSDPGISIDKAKSVPELTKYPLTADKVLRMYRSVTDNGFTSFAEA